MAGILDQKQRVMDFILTDEGRAQAQSGDLNIAYASLSDKETFYDTGVGTPGVAGDASSRIFFEANSRYQDRIVVEANYGVITSFTTADYELDGEEIATTPDRPRTAFESLTLTGSAANDQSDKILTGITKNFYDNQLIGNTDIFSSTSGFDLSEDKITFNPDYQTPIQIGTYTDLDGVYNPPQLSSMTKTLNDRRFAHFSNFKFMPPINKEGTSLGGKEIGFYPNLNEKEIMSYEELSERLSSALTHEISFSNTSRENNILIQPFEFRSEEGSIHKLDIVDFGVFPNTAGTSAGVHVFFIGKVIRSSDGSTKFLNIFTLELDV